MADDIEPADEAGEPLSGRLIPSDYIPFPCHHGCTCDLHSQVVYGEQVPVHPPERLDNGEMALLVEAAENATRRLNGYREHLRRQRKAVLHARTLAEDAVDRFAWGLRSGRVDRANEVLAEVEEHYADVSPADRRPAPLWMKVMTFFGVAGIAVFDAFFFQEAFLDIMQIETDAPWWKRNIGLLGAFVLALGLVVSGRIIAGLAWRIGRHWRRSATPDDRPPSRFAVAFRLAAMLTGPALIFYVLGYWASLRGTVAASDEDLTPGAFPVMLLLLSLALTVVMMEVLIHNPYQATARGAEHDLVVAREDLIKLSAAARAALREYEIAWRDLRSMRDEVISITRAELARPWHTVILPARLRHGRAGPEPAVPLLSGDAATPVTGASADGEEAGGARRGDTTELVYRIFASVDQPQPGAGPLAETIRSVHDLAPEELRDRFTELTERLETLLDQPDERREPEDERREPETVPAPAEGDA